MDTKKRNFPFPNSDSCRGPKGRNNFSLVYSMILAFILFYSFSARVQSGTSLVECKKPSLLLLLPFQLHAKKSRPRALINFFWEPSVRPNQPGKKARYIKLRFATLAAVTS